MVVFVFLSTFFHHHDSHSESSYGREIDEKEGEKKVEEVPVSTAPFSLHGDAETQFSPLSTFLCRVLVRYSPLPSRNSMNCAVSSSQCRGFSPRFMVIP